MSHQHAISPRRVPAATCIGAVSVGDTFRRIVQANVRPGAPQRVADEMGRSRRWVADEIQGRLTAAVELQSRLLAFLPDESAHRALALIAERRGFVVVPASGPRLVRLAADATRAAAEFADVVTATAATLRLELVRVEAALAPGDVNDARQLELPLWEIVP